MRALKKLVQPIAQRQDTFVSHSHGTSTSTPQPSSAAISAASRNMLRASMTDPFFTTTPFASSWITKFAGAFGQIGVQAQTNQKWLNSEPSNAEWKK